MDEEHYELGVDTVVDMVVDGISAEDDEHYEQWLLDNFPEDIHSKDDLIEKSCRGYMYDEYLKYVKEQENNK